MRIPLRYIPKNLSRNDKIKQRNALVRARKEYKKGNYVIRKPLKTFKNKQSHHVTNAQKLYGIDSIKPNKLLARKTKCNIKGLQKIFRKGQGAYYSSGSRPNQTPHSWAYARLASSISGGKASAVDYKILEEFCDRSSKALHLAKNASKRYKKGKKRVPNVNL